MAVGKSQNLLSSREQRNGVRVGAEGGRGQEKTIRGSAIANRYKYPKVRWIVVFIIIIVIIIIY